MRGSDPIPTAERDTNMTKVYVRVLAIEAAVITCLWVFGRIFS